MRLRSKKFYEIVANNLVEKGILDECSVAEAEALCDTIFNSLRESLEERLIDVVNIKDFTFKKFIQKPRELVDLNDKNKKIYLPERYRYTVKINNKE